MLISCTQKTPQANSQSTKERIDAYVKHLQKRHEIPGVALTVIKDNTVFYQEVFGYANIEHSSPIHEQSIFRVYSLTKPIVTVGIFQLIERGALSLEDSIGTYIKGLPNSWEDIQIKHLLTHSTGLPDMAPYHRMEKLSEEEAKKLVFDKKRSSEVGEKYTYNQTNFWLLQLLIEKVSGSSLEDFILNNQFEGNRQQVFFSSNSKDIIKDRVTAYFPFETGTIQISHPTLKGSYMFAANGLNITMEAFVEWNERLLQNKLIKKETREQMWATFPYTKSNKVFTYGWDKRVLNAHPSYGFSGSLITAYRTFPKDNMSIVFLSNGLGNYYNIDNIINHIASIIDEQIVDVNNKAFERLLQVIVEKDVNALEQEFSAMQKEMLYQKINYENMINDVGYQLINQKRMQKAIAVLTFNTQQFPKSANTFDSLGEAYYRNFQDEQAIKSYQKAVELGGTKGNAKRMLTILKK
jgi:CubicO group peptidase (beta-lactamase class C family)